MAESMQALTPNKEVIIDVNDMTNVQKLIEVIRITNQVYGEKYPNGLPGVYEYLNTGNISSFTRTNGARLLASTIEYPKVIFEIQTRLLRNAADFASLGVTQTDNNVINGILNLARQQSDNPNYSTKFIIESVEAIIKNNNNSALILRALTGYVKILQDTQDLEVLSDSAKVLENYATLLDPDVEQKIIFQK